MAPSYLKYALGCLSLSIAAFYFQILHPKQPFAVLFFLVNLADKYNYVFRHGFSKFLLIMALADMQPACGNMVVCLVAHDAVVHFVCTPGLA